MPLQSEKLRHPLLQEKFGKIHLIAILCCQSKRKKENDNQLGIIRH